MSKLKMHYKDCWIGKVHHDCAVRKIRHMQRELAQAQTEIARVNKISDGYATGWADACAARDALARECNELEADREYNASLVMQRDRTIAHVRRELKDLQATDHQFGRQAIRRNRDYWYDKAVAAEAERDKMRKDAQEQSDLVQRDWLSPAEAEGLRRQLKHAEGERDYWINAHDELEVKLAIGAEGEAAIVEAAETYLAQRKRRHLIMDKDCQNLQAALEHRSDAAAKLLERLTYLDDAEAALADCGIGGIYDTFNSLTDAIEQMSSHIRGLGERLEEAERRAAAEKDIAAHYEKNAAAFAHLHAEAKQRTERAEALAALVTPRLIDLLERLAWIAEIIRYPVAAAHGREMAAQIREAREALDDNQA